MIDKLLSMLGMGGNKPSNEEYDEEYAEASEYENEEVEDSEDYETDEEDSEVEEIDEESRDDSSNEAVVDETESSESGDVQEQPATQKEAPVRKKKKIVSYDDLEEVPPHAAILSAVGGDLYQGKGFALDYVALLLDDGSRNNVLIIAKSGLLRSPQVRGAYNLAKSLGKNVGVAEATEEIITSLKEVGDRRASGVKGQSTSEARGYMQFFEEVVIDSVDSDASDIHIEVRKDDAKIRYRVNGRLMDSHELSVGYADKFCRALYNTIASERDSSGFNKQEHQSAIIDREINGRRIRGRLSTIPAYPDGFDMQLRLLPMASEEEPKGAEELGYTPEQAAGINIATSRPVGAFFVAGVGGSGKSTTLVNLLHKKGKVNDGSLKIITVEDPPEYKIPGATQVPVSRPGQEKKNAQKGIESKNPFASAITAAMRADPDILMVGEVRDADSAELLVHATQSGHQVYATIHATSALGIAERLVGLGLDRQVVAGSDFMAGLVYQSLIPTLCPHCCVTAQEFKEGEGALPYDEALMSRIDMVTESDENIRFRGHGCEHCAESGYTGRTIAAEVIVPDANILRLLRDGKQSEARSYWRELGGKTALEHGIALMEAGTISPLDAEHYLGMLTADQLADDGAAASDEMMVYAGTSTEEKPELKVVDSATDAKPEAAVVETVTEPVKTGGNRIMVVDDSITIRKVAQRFLGKAGYEVSVCKDGFEAINTLKVTPEKPDVILLDVEMPRMDGFQFTEMVKSDDKFKNIPIILITSRNDETSIQRAEGLGVAGFVPKPFTEGKLLEHIQLFIGNNNG